MAAVVGSLLVELMADSGQLGKALTAAGHDVTALEGKTTRSLSKMDSAYRQKFASMATSAGSLTRSLAGALAGGVVGAIAGAGLAGLVTQFQDVARGVAEIGDAAKIAGVDVRSFQELRFVADQNRIGVDALTDGLKEMNLRADEFILTGKGSSAEAFQRLGFDAETLAKKLKDPSALFTEIVGKLGHFEKAAQIRIADEIFGGTGGEKFVQLIAQGEAGIRDTIQSARDLGLVMDQQLIERAAEVDRKFNAIAATVGTALKSAIVSAADSLAEFIDGFRAFENQQKNTLQNRQVELASERLDLETQILELQDKQRQRTEPLSDVARNLGFEGSKNGNLAGYSGQIDDARRKLAALAEEDAKVTNALSTRTEPMQRSGTDTWTPPAYTAPAASKSGSRSSSANETERERKAVTELIAELEEELRLVNATDAERRAAEASRRAGAAATDLEREKILALSESLYEEEAARDAATDALQVQKDILNDTLGGLRSALEDGKVTWSELGDIAVSVLNTIADKLQTDLVDALFNVNKTAASGGLFSGGGFGQMSSLGLWRQS